MNMVTRYQSESRKISESSIAPSSLVSKKASMLSRS